MRRTGAYRAVLAGLGMMVTLGCGGARGSRDANTDGATPSAATPQDFCASLARLLCQGRTDCCSDAGPCEVAEELANCREDMDAVLDSGKASYDRATAEHALAIWTGWTERCEPRISEGGAMPWHVLGHVPEGGDCTDSEGTFRSDFCISGMACAQSRCVKPAQLGEACTFAKPCALGSLGCPRGVCVRLKDVGEPCEVPNECESITCEKGKCQGYDFLTDQAFCR